MKWFVSFVLVALLLAGCGEAPQLIDEAPPLIDDEILDGILTEDDPSMPLAIPCEACGKAVSTLTENCSQCGHPTSVSIVAYQKAQRWAEDEAKIQAFPESGAKDDDHSDSKIVLTESYPKEEILYHPNGQIMERTLQSTENDFVQIWKYYENGREKSYEKWSPDRQQRHGKWEEWYDNGAAASIKYYVNGKLHGLEVTWHRSGDKESEGHWIDGFRNGKWSWWCEEGGLAEEGSFTKGKKSEIWKEYSRSDQWGNGASLTQTKYGHDGTKIAYQKFDSGRKRLKELFFVLPTHSTSDYTYKVPDPKNKLKTIQVTKQIIGMKYKRTSSPRRKSLKAIPSRSPRPRPRIAYMVAYMESGWSQWVVFDDETEKFKKSLRRIYPVYPGSIPPDDPRFNFTDPIQTAVKRSTGLSHSIEDKLWINLFNP